MSIIDSNWRFYHINIYILRNGVTTCYIITNNMIFVHAIYVKKRIKDNMEYVILFEHAVICYL